MGNLLTFVAAADPQWESQDVVEFLRRELFIGKKKLYKLKGYSLYVLTDIVLYMNELFITF